MKKKQGTLFLIIGPSRVGKDAILQRILRRKSLKLKELISTTTRKPRPREKEGVHYHFVSDSKFDKLIKSNGFIEWVHIQTHRSGTPKEPVLTWLKNGHDAIADVDMYGALFFQKQKGFQVVTIFILPRRLATLKKRLNASIKDVHERKVRWETTKKELAMQNKFDYRVINEQGKLNQAVDEVASIIKAYKD